MQEIYIGNGTNEYHLHSLNQWLPSFVERGVEGLDNPSMRIDAYDNPGTAGQTIAQSLPGGSLISMSGNLRTPHLADTAQEIAYYTQQRTLFAAATTHRYSPLGRALPLLLRFTDLSGRQLQAEVYKDRYSAPLGHPHRNEWRLQLRNPSGLLESQATRTVTVGLPRPGGFTWDIVWDLLWTESSGGVATATNAGTAAAKPVIRLHGPMLNPVLTNTTTGEFIGLDYALLAGDVITIDSRAHSIIQGEATNRMGSRRAGSVLWHLMPGVNTFTLTADTYASGYAEIEYRDTYGGV